MFEWFAGLPAWLKYGIALIFLGASAFEYSQGVFWPWGWGMGFVLLLAAMVLGDAE